MHTLLLLILSHSSLPAMTIWQIMSKVRVEAFCWGVGTALGELPPYFMARAHRLSGHDPEDDDDDEFLELQQKDPEERVSFLCIPYFNYYKGVPKHANNIYSQISLIECF